MIEHAQRYASIGWHVIPLWWIQEDENGKRVCACGDPKCKSPGKHPIGLIAGGGQHSATTNTNQIRTWWVEYPRANIGIYLRQSGLCAVDIDPRNGGAEMIEDLESQHGKIESDVMAFTGGGGEHRIFEAPANLSLPGKLGKGVDLKLDGYVVVEPSNHESGGKYQWEGSSDPLEGAVASPLPSWIRDIGRQNAPGSSAPKGASSGPLKRELGPDELQRLTDALALIDADPRENWIRVGMALNRDLEPEQGMEIWDAWSKQPDKLELDDQVAKWYSFRRNSLDDSVGLGSIFEMAGAAEIRTMRSSKRIGLHREPYPIEALPAKLGEAITEVINFSGAPLPMVACSAIGALSAAAQGAYDVQRDTGLSGPISINSMVVAESGERKSATDKLFTQGIRKFEKDRSFEEKENICQSHARHSAWQQKMAGIESAIKSAARAGRGTEALEQKLVDSRLREPDKLCSPRVLANDITAEAVKFRLATVYPSMAIITSEGGGFFGGYSMAVDRQTAAFATFNEAWDGNDILVDRRGSDALIVHGARLTVSIQVQLQVLQEFLDKGKGIARSTGFLARFLFAHPESTQGKRKFQSAPAAWPCLDSFNIRIEQLLRMGITRDAQGDRTAVMLKFSRWAKSAWIEFYDEIESKLSPGGPLSEIRDVASKAADNVARLAALFHLLDTDGGEIEERSVRSASAVVHWHINETRRFLREVLASPEEVAAKKLHDWLIDRQQREKAEGEVITSAVSRRDMLRLSPVRSNKLLSDALLLLAEEDVVSEFKAGKSKLWQLS